MACNFAIALASSARLLTASQVARHPDLSWRSQPSKRAKEILRANPTIFERLDGPQNCESRYRLTKDARRYLNVKGRAIAGVTQKAQHWLGIGDIWCELTFSGGRPDQWRTEVDGQFDIYCRWRGKTLLIEYQRTPITSRVWAMKWEARKAWYRQQTWNDRPLIILVDTTGQQEGTIQVPKGTIHVRRIDELRYAFRNA